jgi:hypothetical protein
MDTEQRIAHGQAVIEQMIAIYCHGNHPVAASDAGAADKNGTAPARQSLCPSCAELTEYARKRTECCPLGDDKPFCSNCRVHCYSAAMRARIQEVMRYAGPRMLKHNPILATRHLIAARQEKKRLAKQG